ncbi:MAG: peptide-methionine (R)-S-oxide reductase MsrB [Rhodobacteraceae bacterium]|nr:peptide-methionine (R)-S-oxide reductase MsrB [Paracoccaceae bacterium]
MDRRSLLLAPLALAARPVGAGETPFEITRTEAEWRAMLSGPEYAVMREAATEPPGSSPLAGHFAPGTYHCRGCDLPLFASADKYDSGTGWPSFHTALAGALGTREDRRFLFQLRTECHCRRCGCHLGHVFDDGPPPTGRRYCINGLSLVFRPA